MATERDPLFLGKMKDYRVIPIPLGPSRECSTSMGFILVFCFFVSLVCLYFV